MLITLLIIALLLSLLGNFAHIRKVIRDEHIWHWGRYGNFWHRFSFQPWCWAMAVCKFHDRWNLHLFCLWVELGRPRVEPEDIMESWGWSIDPDFPAIHLTWGTRCKIIRMPWDYDHCRVQVGLLDGRFVHYEKYPCRGYQGLIDEPADIYRKAFPYTYVTSDNTTQIRLATVTVERRSWCWRSWPFRAWRWPAKVRTSINVEFNNEVGDDTGSWKGGTVGCGWDLLPGEDPEACLRRMEKERRFPR